MLVVDEYEFIRSMHFSPGVTEKHKHMIPVMANVLFRLLRNSYQTLHKLVFRSDGLTANKNLAKYVIKHLMENEAIEQITNSTTNDVYNLAELLSSHFIKVCQHVVMITHYNTIIVHILSKNINYTQSAVCGWHREQTFRKDRVLWNKKVDPEKTLAYKDRVKISQKHDLPHEYVYQLDDEHVTLQRFLRLHESIYTDKQCLATLQHYVKWKSRLRFAQPATSTEILNLDFWKVCQLQIINC